MKTKPKKDSMKRRGGWLPSALRGAGVGLTVILFLLLLFCAITCATEDPGPLVVPLSLCALYLGGIVLQSLLAALLLLSLLYELLVSRRRRLRGRRRRLGGHVAATGGVPLLLAVRSVFAVTIVRSLVVEVLVAGIGAPLRIGIAALVARPAFGRGFGGGTVRRRTGRGGIVRKCVVDRRADFLVH